MNFNGSLGPATENVVDIKTCTIRFLLADTIEKVYLGFGRNQTIEYYIIYFLCFWNYNNVNFLICCDVL